MTTFSVYIATCAASGKRYIGLTGRTVEKRWKAHVYNALKDRQGALYAAIRLHGEGAFTVETFRSGLTREQACIVEMAMIEARGTQSPGGYNLTIGGDGANGAKLSDETKARMSAAHKARQADPELRRRTSEALKGRPKTAEHNARVGAANAGKTPSAETREKLRQANLGKKQSPETIAKRVEKLRGREPPEHRRNWLGDHTRGKPKTEEQRRKLSEALKGRKLDPEHVAKRAAAQTGAKRSPETRAKMREAALRNAAKRREERLASSAV